MVFYPCFHWCLCKQTNSVVPYSFLVLLPSWSYSNGLVNKLFSFVSEGYWWSRLTNHICQWDIIITLLHLKLGEDGIFPLVEVVLPKLWWLCYIQGIQCVFCDFRLANIPVHHRVGESCGIWYMSMPSLLILNILSESMDMGVVDGTKVCATMGVGKGIEMLECIQNVLDRCSEHVNVCYVSHTLS